MGVSRCLGIGIVMIIPSFVGGGAVWDLFNSWAAVFTWLFIMVLVYVFILLRTRCSVH
jgi:hypothetical protein